MTVSPFDFYGGFIIFLFSSPLGSLLSILGWFAILLGAGWFLILYLLGRLSEHSGMYSSMATDLFFYFLRKHWKVLFLIMAGVLAVSLRQIALEKVEANPEAGYPQNVFDKM